jgi:hypothetical protein
MAEKKEKLNAFDRFIGTVRFILNFGKEDRHDPEFTW